MKARSQPPQLFPRRYITPHAKLKAERCAEAFHRLELRLGRPPGVREVAQELGITSSNTCHLHMIAAVDLGLLRHHPYCSPAFTSYTIDHIRSICQIAQKSGEERGLAERILALVNGGGQGVPRMPGDCEESAGAA